MDKIPQPAGFCASKAWPCPYLMAGNGALSTPGMAKAFGRKGANA